jgi:hypothetical protein
MRRSLRLDQLQRLLLRYTPEADRGKVNGGADRLSKERTYRTLTRWEALGFIEFANILDGEPRWVWLTAQCLREIGSALRYGCWDIDPFEDTESRISTISGVRTWSHFAGTVTAPPMRSSSSGVSSARSSANGT